MVVVIVSSTNPVKIEATREAFQQAFPGDAVVVESVSVASGVGAQPDGERETWSGARTRAAAALAAAPHADYAVGIEGGIIQDIEGHSEMFTFAWICVLSKDGRVGKSKTAHFLVPKEIAALIHQGMELGVATDAFFKKTNSKRSGGVIECITNGLIVRKQLYSPAVLMALVPFMNEGLTW
eukprot:TRINITY_DN20536_c0_g1_i1.p1 TRINITY_DN20536_c0_g1~~TRINITY_DN20536_c0_g1_i1.p1  ORF type:complete len:181 (+),score=21.94 TRINITY_DN20536_c0_g1_i1:5-547(+)